MIDLETHKKTATRRNDRGFSPGRGVFHPLRIGDYDLSIQGSDYSYSEPRECLISLDSYSEVEIALIHKKRGFINLFDAYPEHSELWEKIGHDGMVSGYVSWENVEALYNIVKQEVA